jgi:hypothetical protein
MGGGEELMLLLQIFFLMLLLKDAHELLPREHSICCCVTAKYHGALGHITTVKITLHSIFNSLRFVITSIHYLTSLSPLPDFSWIQSEVHLTVPRNCKWMFLKYISKYNFCLWCVNNKAKTSLHIGCVYEIISHFQLTKHLVSTFLAPRIHILLYQHQLTFQMLIFSLCFNRFNTQKYNTLFNVNKLAFNRYFYSRGKKLRIFYLIFWRHCRRVTSWAAQRA